MLWSWEATRFVLMLRLKKVGFDWPADEPTTKSLTSCSISSVTSPRSLMYGTKVRMTPTSRYSTEVVVTGGFVLVFRTEVVIGIWSTTLIFDFFPFVAMTLGEERTDALPSSASDRNAAVRRFVFSIT